MEIKIVLSALIYYLTFTVSTEAVLNDQCASLSCVHASATILQKLNSDVDPCDDFYEFACGSFLEQQHTPDEKSTVDTIALMSDKLTEYLLTLLLQPSEGVDSKLHKLAKTFFNNCFDAGELSEMKREKIKVDD